MFVQRSHKKQENCLRIFLSKSLNRIFLHKYDYRPFPLVNIKTIHLLTDKVKSDLTFSTSTLYQKVVY